MSDIAINWLDIGFMAVLLLFGIRGLLRGLVKEVAGLVSVILGFFLASRYYPQVMPYFEQWIKNQDTRMYAAYAAIFIAVVIVTAVVAMAVQKFMAITFISWLDRAAGGCAGVAKGALLCSVLLAFLKRFDANAPLLKNSQVIGYLDQVIAFSSNLLPVLQ